MFEVTPGSPYYRPFYCSQIWGIKTGLCPGSAVLPSGEHFIRTIVLVPCRIRRPLARGIQFATDFIFGRILRSLLKSFSLIPYNYLKSAPRFFLSEFLNLQELEWGRRGETGLIFFFFSFSSNEELDDLVNSTEFQNSLKKAL